MKNQFAHFLSLIILFSIINEISLIKLEKTNTKSSIKLWNFSLNNNKSKGKDDAEVAGYNRVPEYMANFFGQGHQLDCLNRCKVCVDEAVVKKSYFKLKDDLKLDFVMKTDLMKEIKAQIKALEGNKSEYDKLIKKKENITAQDTDPKNLFRIYFDQCYIYNKGFYN